MKQNEQIPPATITLTSESTKDINNLIDEIILCNDGDHIGDIKTDFLEMSLRELVSGEWFSGLDRERKHHLMNQYSSLVSLVDAVRGFANRYPEGIIIEEARVVL